MLSWERISKHEAIDSPEGVRKRVKPSIASALQDSVVDLIEQKVPDAPAQEEGNNRKKQNHTDRHDPVAVDRDLPMNRAVCDDHIAHRAAPFIRAVEQHGDGVGDGAEQK